MFSLVVGILSLSPYTGRYSEYLVFLNLIEIRESPGAGPGLGTLRPETCKHRSACAVGDDAHVYLDQRLRTYTTVQSCTDTPHATHSFQV